jgi:hypothetical protein
VSSNGDPHRVLGVPRDASEAEIRRAYRALAKRHHPDGGQGSVARFLVIQAAYEALTGGSPGAVPGDARPRAPSGPPPGASRRHGSDWARRPRPSSSARRDEGAGEAAGSKTGEREGPEPARDRRAAGRRRATLGSTTYDEVEEVFEPGWGGASWYGPSSGTYWTLNPREYADPRKHGPEYQARARRPLGAASAETAAPPDSAAAASTPPTPPAPAPASAPASAPPAPPRAADPRPGLVARILGRLRRGTIRA